MTNAQDVIVRYLQDAVAAEKASESQFRDFAKNSGGAQAQAVFELHADQTHQQKLDLEQRLHLLDASPSAMKGLMTSLFGAAPKAVQGSHGVEGKTAQNLMLAYAAENMEIALYEALAIAAREAGDAITEQLARRIQEEEKLTAEKVFALLPGAEEQTYQAKADAAARP